MAWMYDRSMEIELEWLRPIELRHLSPEGFIYSCAFDALPESAGVYVFARRHGESVTPLYIGQAENLQRRIRQQFDSVRLMKGIEAAETGARLLLIAEVRIRGRQQVSKVLDIVENAIIQNALTNNHEILNKQGTRRPTHAIASYGALWSRQILPLRTRVRQGGGA